MSISSIAKLIAHHPLLNGWQISEGHSWCKVIAYISVSCTNSLKIAIPSLPPSLTARRPPGGSVQPKVLPSLRGPCRMLLSRRLPLRAQNKRRSPLRRQIPHCLHASRLRQTHRECHWASIYHHRSLEGRPFFLSRFLSCWTRPRNECLWQRECENGHYLALSSEPPEEDE